MVLCHDGNVLLAVHVACEVSDAEPARPQVPT
jgi:hypothetical protein